jgi:hypothetical protein
MNAERSGGIEMAEDQRSRSDKIWSAVVIPEMEEFLRSICNDNPISSIG